jgi:hypothetical protein
MMVEIGTYLTLQVASLKEATGDLRRMKSHLILESPKMVSLSEVTIMNVQVKCPQNFPQIGVMKIARDPRFP